MRPDIYGKLLYVVLNLRVAGREWFATLQQHRPLFGRFSACSPRYFTQKYNQTLRTAWRKKQTSGLSACIKLPWVALKMRAPSCQ
jgi:hypothetical protein